MAHEKGRKPAGAKKRPAAADAGSGGPAKKFKPSPDGKKPFKKGGEGAATAGKKPFKKPAKPEKKKILDRCGNQQASPVDCSTYPAQNRITLRTCIQALAVHLVTILRGSTAPTVIISMAAGLRRCALISLSAQLACLVPFTSCGRII